MELYLRDRRQSIPHRDIVMNQTQAQEKPDQDTREAEHEESGEEEEVRTNDQSLTRPNAQTQAVQRRQDTRMQGPPHLLSDDFYGTWFDEQRRWELQQQKSKDMMQGEDTLRLRLDLNLDIEVKLRAHLHGDLTLALL